MKLSSNGGSQVTIMKMCMLGMIPLKINHWIKNHRYYIIVEILNPSTNYEINKTVFQTGCKPGAYAYVIVLFLLIEMF